MAKSTIQLAYQASLLGTTATATSGSLTATVNLTAGWQINIPVEVTWKSVVSNDAVINAYPSYDGGVTYDSSPLYSVLVPRLAGSAKSRASIVLPAGQYALQILNSGPSSGSAAIGTAQIVTAIVG